MQVVVSRMDQACRRKLGRRAVEVDLARVERFRGDGLGLRAIAAKLGISVTHCRSTG